MMRFRIFGGRDREEEELPPAPAIIRETSGEKDSPRTAMAKRIFAKTAPAGNPWVDTPDLIRIEEAIARAHEIASEGGVPLQTGIERLQEDWIAPTDTRPSLTLEFYEYGLTKEADVKAWLERMAAMIYTEIAPTYANVKPSLADGKAEEGPPVTLERQFIPYGEPVYTPPPAPAPAPVAPKRAAPRPAAPRPVAPQQAAPAPAPSRPVFQHSPTTVNRWYDSIEEVSKFQFIDDVQDIAKLVENTIMPPLLAIDKELTESNRHSDRIPPHHSNFKDVIEELAQEVSNMRRTNETRDSFLSENHYQLVAGNLARALFDRATTLREFTYDANFTVDQRKTITQITDSITGQYKRDVSKLVTPLKKDVCLVGMLLKLEKGLQAFEAKKLAPKDTNPGRFAEAVRPAEPERAQVIEPLREVLEEKQGGVSGKDDFIRFAGEVDEAIKKLDNALVPYGHKIHDEWQMTRGTWSFAVNSSYKRLKQVSQEVRSRASEFQPYMKLSDHTQALWGAIYQIDQATRLHSGYPVHQMMQGTTEGWLINAMKQLIPLAHANSPEVPFDMKDIPQVQMYLHKLEDAPKAEATRWRQKAAQSQMAAIEPKRYQDIADMLTHEAKRIHGIVGFYTRGNDLIADAAIMRIDKIADNLDDISELMKVRAEGKVESDDPKQAIRELESSLAKLGNQVSDLNKEVGGSSSWVLRVPDATRLKGSVVSLTGVPTGRYEGNTVELARDPFNRSPMAELSRLVRDVRNEPQAGRNF